MSIPKEPRQLMINLMYLVLTALLALNVSAEIINAFFSLNSGIKASNKIVDNSNLNLKGSIDEQAKAYPVPANLAFQSDANKVIEISKNFCAYMDGVTSELTQKAGGKDSIKFKDGRPKHFKDKDVTTRWFITEKKGDEIEAKVKETREMLLAAIKDPKDRAS